MDFFFGGFPYVLIYPLVNEHFWGHHVDFKRSFPGRRPSDLNKRCFIFSEREKDEANNFESVSSLEWDNQGQYNVANDNFLCVFQE